MGTRNDKTVRRIVNKKKRETILNFMREHQNEVVEATIGAIRGKPFIYRLQTACKILFKPKRLEL